MPVVRPRLTLPGIPSSLAKTAPSRLFSASKLKAASSKMDSLGIAVKRIAPRRASTTASSNKVKPAAPGGEPSVRKLRIRKSPARNREQEKAFVHYIYHPGRASSDIYHAP